MRRALTKTLVSYSQHGKLLRKNLACSSQIKPFSSSFLALQQQQKNENAKVEKKNDEECCEEKPAASATTQQQPEPAKTETPSQQKQEEPKTQTNAQQEKSSEENQQKQEKQEEEEQESYVVKRLLSPRTWILPIIVGGALAYYTLTRSDSLEQVEKIKGIKTTPVKTVKVANAMVGGSFTLINAHTLQPVTDSEFRGKWLLVYFGFTNCPDFCPEEMRKMTEAINSLDPSLQKDILPLFISVDPRRDSCASIVDYLKEFHPSFVGLTGTPEQIARICKKYRVYYVAPKYEEGKDYIVDHSVFIYFMDPQGYFVEFFGRNLNAAEISKSMKENINQFPQVLEMRRQQLQQQQQQQQAANSAQQPRTKQ